MTEGLSPMKGAPMFDCGDVCMNEEMKVISQLYNEKDAYRYYINRRKLAMVKALCRILLNMLQCIDFKFLQDAFLDLRDVLDLHKELQSIQLFLEIRELLQKNENLLW